MHADVRMLVLGQSRYADAIRLCLRAVCHAVRIGPLRTKQDKRRTAVGARCAQVKPSCVSTGSLKASQPLHVPPIKLVVYQRTYQTFSVRELILRLASHLDAFSGYPSQT